MAHLSGPLIPPRDLAAENEHCQLGETMSADELVDDVVHELGKTDPSSTVW
jgi:hypothetical protein